MNARSVFHLISDVSAQEGVPCVLIGGFAVNYHKVTRQTADVDFLTTKEGFDKLSPLENAGYGVHSAHESFTQLKNDRIALMDVDFMFVEKATLDKILEKCEILEIAGQQFRVPSLFHLIALKLHSIKYNERNRMTRDLPDIVNLIKINNLSIDDPSFIELCNRYGTEGIYMKLKDAIHG